MPNLEEFRNKIDAVDDKILDLLNERMMNIHINFAKNFKLIILT